MKWAGRPAGGRYHASLTTTPAGYYRIEAETMNRLHFLELSIRTGLGVVSMRLAAEAGQLGNYSFDDDGVLWFENEDETMRLADELRTRLGDWLRQIGVIQSIPQAALN